MQVRLQLYALTLHLSPTCVKVMKTSIPLWSDDQPVIVWNMVKWQRCGGKGKTMWNKQEIEIVLSIQSKYGLFLLIVLLRITEVSKELGVDLFFTILLIDLLPSCNEHAGAEASWYHSYGSWCSGYVPYDAFASPFYTTVNTPSLLTKTTQSIECTTLQQNLPLSLYKDKILWL